MFKRTIDTPTVEGYVDKALKLLNSDKVGGGGDGEIIVCNGCPKEVYQAIALLNGLKELVKDQGFSNLVPNYKQKMWALQELHTWLENTDHLHQEAKGLHGSCVEHLEAEAGEACEVLGEKDTDKAVYLWLSEHFKSEV